MPDNQVGEITIKVAESQQEKEQLDELLWVVLWKPLNLPRDIGAKLGLPGEKIELIAVEDEMVVGALVANWIGETELEIRHLAVDENHQGKSIGTRLISRLFGLVKKNNPVRIRTYARNTSYRFFVKLGFKLVTEAWKEVPDFKSQGITFKLAEKIV